MVVLVWTAALLVASGALGAAVYARLRTVNARWLRVYLSAIPGSVVLLVSVISFSVGGTKPAKNEAVGHECTLAIEIHADPTPAQPTVVLGNLIWLYRSSADCWSPANRSGNLAGGIAPRPILCIVNGDVIRPWLGSCVRGREMRAGGGATVSNRPGWISTNLQAARRS